MIFGDIAVDHKVERKRLFVTVRSILCLLKFPKRNKL